MSIRYSVHLWQKSIKISFQAHLQKILPPLDSLISGLIDLSYCPQESSRRSPCCIFRPRRANFGGQWKTFYQWCHMSRWFHELLYSKPKWWSWTSIGQLYPTFVAWQHFLPTQWSWSWSPPQWWAGSCQWRYHQQISSKDWIFQQQSCQWARSWRYSRILSGTFVCLKASNYIFAVKTSDFNSFAFPILILPFIKSMLII